MLRQIILDTETTGLDPNNGHRIIEIGCVEIIDRVITGNTLHLYLNPSRKVDPGALNIHGLSDEFLSNKPFFYEIVDDLLKFLKNSELIAHNAAFDIKFLNAELNKIKLNNIDSYCSKITDSLAVARKNFPGKKNSLDALCERYNINNSHRKLHGALLDAKLLAEIWLYMTRGQNSLSLLIDERNKDSTQKNVTKAITVTRYELPIILANKYENIEHENYLKALYAISGSVLWHEFND